MDNKTQVEATVASYHKEVASVVDRLAYTLKLAGYDKREDETLPSFFGRVDATQFDKALVMVQRFPCRTFYNRFLSLNGDSSLRIKDKGLRQSVVEWTQKNADCLARWDGLVKEINTGDAAQFKGAVNSMFRELGHGEKPPFDTPAVKPFGGNIKNVAYKLAPL